MGKMYHLASLFGGQWGNAVAGGTRFWSVGALGHGWGPKHGLWSALTQHRALSHTAGASNVICHWLSK